MCEGAVRTTFMQTYYRFVLSVSRCVKAIMIMTDIIVIIIIKIKIYTEQ